MKADSVIFDDVTNVKGTSIRNIGAIQFAKNPTTTVTRGLLNYEMFYNNSNELLYKHPSGAAIKLVNASAEFGGVLSNPSIDSMPVKSFSISNLRRGTLPNGQFVVTLDDGVLGSVAGSGILPKASGVDVDTGESTDKVLTPKSMGDSGYLKVSDKATVSDVTNEVPGKYVPPSVVRDMTAVPQHGIIFMTSGTVCPAGYTEVTLANGRFIKASTTAGTNSGASTHSHTVTHSHAIANAGFTMQVQPGDYNANYRVGPTNVSTTAANMSDAPNNPEHRTVILCKKD